MLRLFSMLVLLVTFTSQILIIISLCPDAYMCPVPGFFFSLLNASIARVLHVANRGCKSAKLVANVLLMCC